MQNGLWHTRVEIVTAQIATEKNIDRSEYRIKSGVDSSMIQ